MNIKQPISLKLIIHSLAVATLCSAVLLLSAPVNASALKDYQKLNVYGVQQGAPTSVADAQELLDNARLNDTPLGSETESAIHRFLVYDALKHYLGFLLHINPKPGMDYFNSFKTLGTRLEGDFPTLQRSAVQTALKLSHELRFDVSMVQLSTKEIYNKDGAQGIEKQIEVIVNRLTKISNKLAHLYPESNGELPPILLAYVSSVFTPKTESERIACAKKFSEEVKSDVFRILATQELKGLGQLLQSPVTYNITPMGNISSRVKKQPD